MDRTANVTRLLASVALKRRTKGAHMILLECSLVVTHFHLAPKIFVLLHVCFLQMFPGTDKFGGLLKECMFIIIAGSGMAAVRQHCTTSLTQVFRTRLTRKIQEGYFGGMSYYHIANLPGKNAGGRPRAIEDADERVTSEVRSVSTRLTMLVTLLIKSVPPIVWFTFKLWRQVPVSECIQPQRQAPKTKSMLTKPDPDL
jgi:ABC-type uncharacterized transport system fused permease/ATPase subunit